VCAGNFFESVDDPLVLGGRGCALMGKAELLKKLSDERA